jgi:hypothetical protein
MTLDGGYQEGDDQNHDILTGKQYRGMNYPCPNKDCILTFTSEELMKKHLDEEDHVLSEEVVVQSTSDRVKKSWVAGLGGKVALRKSG